MGEVDVKLVDIKGMSDSELKEFMGKNTEGGKVAWYLEDDVIVIDSLPLLLARIATRPGGSGFQVPKDYFGG